MAQAFAAVIRPNADARYRQTQEKLENGMAGFTVSDFSHSP
jgi:hypothetical protein